MDEHVANPASNRLPPGLDESKLVDAVRNSGYPLQAVVASALSSTFTVVEEWGFTDRETEKHRTLDIYAFRELMSSDSAFRPRLHLLVECKRSALPYVFFRPGVVGFARDFPQVIGFGRLSLSLENNAHRDASPAEFFCATELPFASGAATIASTFAHVEGKDKGLKLSGTVPFNEVVMPLASAMEQVRVMFGGGNRNSPMIVLAVGVLDAPMVLAGGTPEVPQVELIPWVRVVHHETVRESNHWRGRHYTIDFVHRGFLSSYIDEHALPFAASLTKRFTEFRRVAPGATAPGAEGSRLKDCTWDQFMGR